MKKNILCMMLAFVFALSAVAGANPLAKSGAEVASTVGSIASIEGNRVLVKGEGNYDEIELRIAETTHVVNGQSGAKIAMSELKKGNLVTAYYGGAVTRSLPPQGNAVAIVVGGTDDRAMYMRVAQVKQEDAAIRVLNTNGDRLVRINANQVQDIDTVREGSEILVWYKIMTLSMPGQATSTKTVVLSTPADLKVHLTSGVIVANGEELRENVIVVDNMAYLPLRNVCEKLGYEVQWNDTDKSIMVVKGAKTASLTVGSQEYAKLKMRVRLDEKPMVVGGKTFVPAAFFSEVMDLQVEILTSDV